MVTRQQCVLFGAVLAIGCGAPSVAPPPIPPASVQAPAQAPAPSPSSSSQLSPPHDVAPTPTWFLAAAVQEPAGTPRIFHDAGVVGGGARDLRIQGDELVEIDFTKLADDKLPAPDWKLVQGAWPSETWAAQELVGSGDSSGTILLHFTPKGWTRIASFDTIGLPMFLGIGLWSNKAVLTVVEGATRSGDPSQPDTRYIRPPKLRVLSGHAPGKLPRLDVRGEDRLIGFTALPRGDLFLAGTHSEDGKVFVDHWTPGAARAERAELAPGLGSGPPTNRTRLLLVRSESEGYLAGGSEVVEGGSPYLARYDGASWTTLDLPTKAPLHGYDVTPDGEVWCVFDGPWMKGSSGSARREVWKRSRGALAWERVRLDSVAFRAGVARVNPIDVLARGSTDAWILADLELPGGVHATGLLHNRPSSRMLDL